MNDNSDFFCKKVGIYLCTPQQYFQEAFTVHLWAKGKYVLVQEVVQEDGVVMYQQTGNCPNRGPVIMFRSGLWAIFRNLEVSVYVDPHSFSKPNQGPHSFSETPVIAIEIKLFL